jgi:phosphohistidine phosphatase
VIELYLLRHADAGDPMAWQGPDAARPLSGKGERQADRLGRFLSGIGFTPDAIITSPKVRAAQTAEGIARRLGVTVAIDDRLAEGVDLRALDAVLRSAGDPARPVLVGHDPDFSELVETLTASPAVTMKKGAMLRIDVERPLEPGGGSLVWLVPPALLKPAG